jgi:hypothetical protein
MIPETASVRSMVKYLPAPEAELRTNDMRALAVSGSWAR